jgi:peptide/nickel transport system permease protein
MAARGRLWVGSAMVAAMALLALLAPWLAPHAPNDVGVGAANLPPCAEFWLGTDSVGRDCLSRLLYGARISLPIGLLAVLVATTVGTAVGTIAGYAGGWTDRAALWVVDLLMALPRLVLLLAVVAVLGGHDGSRILLVAAVLGLTGWMPVARVVRSQVLSLRQREFVLAARAAGLPPAAIVARHVVPNVLTPVIVNGALLVGTTILLEAALSFLGLGVPLPAPSWGAMVGSGTLHAWWLSVFPGAAIALTVLGFNLLGDGLRAMSDPRAAA